MRLLMIESDEKGIWYFTGLQECANFLNVQHYETVEFRCYKDM